MLTLVSRRAILHHRIEMPAVVGVFRLYMFACLRQDGNGRRVIEDPRVDVDGDTNALVRAKKINVIE